MDSVHAKVRGYSTTLLKLVFVAALFYWMFSSGHLRFKDLQSLLTLRVCFWGMILVLINTLLNHARWYTILKSQCSSVGYWSTLPLTFIGLFFNFFVPGSVGGDVMKAYYITKNFHEDQWRAGVSVLMDRLIGLFVMLLWGAAATLNALPKLQSGGPQILISVSILASGLVLFFAVCCIPMPKLEAFTILRFFLSRPWLRNTYQSIHLYRHSLPTIFKAVAISVVAQSFAYAVIWLAGSAVEPQIPLGAYLFSAPLGFMLTSVPISPAGIGVGQAVFLALFNLYLGYQSNVGMLGITLFQAVLLCWSLVGAYFYVTRRRGAALNPVLQVPKVSS